VTTATAAGTAGTAEAKMIQDRRAEAAAERRRPLVAELKRNSLDDGPGIRTTVFFKGCPLRCAWCHNPETQDPGPEIMRVDNECLGCGACVQACPTGAMTRGAGPRTPVRAVRDPARCRACGRCVDVCPGRGVRLVGSYYEPEKLAELAALDQPFYRNSGGGVTLSGGEPTLYPRYTERLVRALKARGLDVLLETCGYFAWDVFSRRILPHLDTVYFDLKLADPNEHARWTGRDNRLILENLRRLAARRAPRPRLLVRIPLVPGVTATAENLAAIARILKELALKEAAVLPYNPLWLAKAHGLGRTASYSRSVWMTPAEESECVQVLASEGVIVVR